MEGGLTLQVPKVQWWVEYPVPHPRLNKRACNSHLLKRYEIFTIEGACRERITIFVVGAHEAVERAVEFFFELIPDFSDEGILVPGVVITLLPCKMVELSGVSIPHHLIVGHPRTAAAF